MLTLQAQKDFRRLRALDFCYFCGEPFYANSEKTRDHIPPESIFLTQDRTPPLILNAHKKCNCEQSHVDNEIGQLINILHNKIPERKNKILKYGFFKGDDGKIFGLLLLNFKEIIFRWIRGFHTALYHEYLPIPSLKAVHPPINSAIIKKEEIIREPIQEQQLIFVDVIKKNRKAGSLDKIISNNGKCKYECIWYRSIEGKWFCIFALQLYDWRHLGDGDQYPLRGCVGFYSPASGLSQKATVGTEMEIFYKNQDKLDPFGA